MFLVLRTGAACRLIGAHAAIGSGCGWVGIWRNRWAFALCLPLPLRLAVPLTLCFPLGVALRVPLRVPLAFARAALPITTIAAVTPLTASATLAGPSRALLRTVTLTLALAVARAVAATITPVATLAAALPVAVATAIAIAIAMIAT